VSGPSAGNLTLNNDGSFTYVPGEAFDGRDTFTYKLSDGWDESNVATVRIADSAVNQAPVAGDDDYQVAKNTQLVQTSPGLLANDTDGDGDPLSVLPGRNPSKGTLKLSPDGSFVYSPTIGFVGVDSFTYSVADSLGVTRTATATITVGNLQPTAVDDQAITQPGKAVTIAVAANDDDADGDPLTITIVAQPEHGTATVNGNEIVYTPMAGFSGSDNFIYRITDDKGSSDTATVTIAVVKPTILLPSLSKAK
jgi:hypothetical protein